MTLELQISYSPDFSLTFRFVRAEHVASMGHVSWLFEFRCIVRHSKGHFTYDANDLFFPLDAFERFHNQLLGIREGRCQSAVLADEGEMVSLALNIEGHKLKSSIQIREYQAGNDLSALSAGFWVDYDLFVNKMYVEVGDFIDSLREVSPQNV